MANRNGTELVRAEGPVGQAHRVLSGIRERLRKRFGASVGSVFVAAVRTEGEEEAPDRDSFQVFFKLGTKQITLTVLSLELETNGMVEIDRSYDRLMGN